MNLVSKINKISFKIIIGLIVIFLIQLLIKYVFLKPQTSSISKNQNFIISTIDKNSIQEVNIKTGSLKIRLLKLSSGWSLVYPRKFPANNNFVNTLIDQIIKIKVHDVLTKDFINISNYSLEKPSYKITLKNTKNSYQFTFGIFNTIINSTYLLLSNQDVIYKTNIPNILRKNFNLSNIINTKIFQVNFKDLRKIKIYFGKRELNKIALSLTLKKNTWVGKKNRILDTLKVKKRISSLFNINSQLIFDTVNLDQKKIIEQRLKYPRYTIELVTTNKRNIYKVSYLLPSIKKLKIKGDDFFIISNKKTFPFLVRKKFMKILEKREASLRAYNLKKLYY